MNNELEKQMDVLVSKDKRLMDRFVPAARAIVPILKDHHLDNSAKELEVLLFEFDANRQEMSNLIESDLEGFVKALVRNLSAQRS